jgi:beta-glucosidase
MHRILIGALLFALVSIGCNEKGGEPSPIKDAPALAQELLDKMTLDEKIGQMTQVDRTALNGDANIAIYFIGSILNGGGGAPANNSAAGWADMYDSYQTWALKTRLKIPIIYGVDAVHGHNNLKDAVIFPHNIGLGCTRNVELVENAAKITAEEVAATGIDWTFAPCIAVVRNERWGRTYEGFGETTELAEMMAAAAVKGFQGSDLKETGRIAACAKHYLADGGTLNGDDQGNAIMSEEELRRIHLPGYISAIKAGAVTVMASYSSFNGTKMHGNKYLLTDVLKTELGFKGFVVSDWKGINQLPGSYADQVQASINAGVDMVMVPDTYVDFIKTLKSLVQQGKVPMERINDAVKRILTVKYQLGLFDQPYTNRSLLAGVGSQEHREVARACVRESLVLLKNSNNMLPLSKNLTKIVVAGKSANDIGNQCGGWSISWQGNSGAITAGTTVYEAVKSAVSSNTVVELSSIGTNVSGADVAIAVIGETPYAEFEGDRDNLALDASDVQTLNNLKNAGVPIVTVLISGRPMIITTQLEQSAAFVAAWLPGTEAKGITDVLFGDYNFKGKLSHSWPKTMSQIPINTGDGNYDPLFPYGYGLTYQGN